MGIQTHLSSTRTAFFPGPQLGRSPALEDGGVGARLGETTPLSPSNFNNVITADKSIIPSFLMRSQLSALVKPMGV